MTNKLEVIDDNVIQYDGRTLWTDVLPIPFRGAKRDYYLPVSSRELESILRVGSSAIRYAIQDVYEQQYERLAPQGYTVARPSLWVAQLGNARQTDGRHSEVYSPKGYENGGIHFEADEQHSAFYDHWQAVREAGFMPHVRGSIDGAWLMLRDDDER